MSDDLEKELYGERKESDAERLAKETREQDWKDLLSTPGGRRIMWGLMQEFGLYTGAGGEYGNGMRDCALSIRYHVRGADSDKEFWRTMVMENDR